MTSKQFSIESDRKVKNFLFAKKIERMHQLILVRKQEQEKLQMIKDRQEKKK
jgi:hypothetical protein